MGKKQGQCKVYEFATGRSPKLKTVKYISPEKKQLLRQREEAKTDKRHFYIGAGILLVIVAGLTFLIIK
ncbi:MAG: hypothetical protein A4E55_02138 [Pelotomaculum sp. PtaU1.Bin035]|nr:MAG: hypothetical protein A4E55_02138 [Pelotomaculum sp. PtaU1.Bin035]